MSVKVVAAQVEGAPHALRVLLAAVVAVGREDAVDDVLLGDGRRPRLVIVAHEVVASALAGIASVGGSPVVEDVVAQVHQLTVVPPLRTAAVQPRRAAAVVCQQVVVEGSALAAPDGAIAVIALDVYALRQALAEDAPLHGEVFVAIEGGTLVRAPAHAAMVYDDILVVAPPDGIALVLPLVAHAAAQEADDDIVGFDHQRIVLQANAVAGGCLPGNGHVAFLYLQVALQLDDARHVEHDDARPALLHPGTQRARAAVVQVGHVVDLASAAAGGGVAGKALGARKCRSHNSGLLGLFRRVLARSLRGRRFFCRRGRGVA